MTEIKPIETVYKGYKFRSRLEARWAVFFDACNVKWEYEPEGYDLGDGVCYLPDFLLHDIGIRSSEDEGKLYDLYVEVKGFMTEEDINKIEKFSGYIDDDIKHPVLIVGNIPEDIDEMCNFPYGYYSFRYIDYDEFEALLVIKDGKLVIRGADSNYLRDVDEEGTEKALALARQARFEHGEKTYVTPLNRRPFYKEICFDSQLDARWAVFFDNCNICWKYKPKIFFMDDIKYPYSPTFLLYGVKIKGDDKLIDLFVDIRKSVDEIDKVDYPLIHKYLEGLLDDSGGFILNNYNVFIVNRIISDYYGFDQAIKDMNCLYKESSSCTNGHFFSFSNIDGDCNPAFPCIDSEGNFRLVSFEYFNLIDKKATINALSIANTISFPHK